MKTKLFVILLFCLYAAFEVSAQKKPLLNNHEEVAARAKSDLDSLMKTGAPFQVEAARRGLAGEYVVDITIFDKGKIQSIFMVNSNADNAAMQNRVKDFIRTIEFSFKVPKATSYKIRYTFLF